MDTKYVEYTISFKGIPMLGHWVWVVFTHILKFEINHGLNIRILYLPPQFLKFELQLKIFLN